jgi:hypothetical protein
MAYATVDQLAAVMRLAVTAKNQAFLQQCLDGAAQEIDHYCGRLAASPLPPTDPLAGLVNVVRGVEWYKANDAVFGGVGFADVGILTVPKDSFGRYAAALTPLVQTFGVG